MRDQNEIDRRSPHQKEMDEWDNYIKYVQPLEEKNAKEMARAKKADGREQTQYLLIEHRDGVEVDSVKVCDTLEEAYLTMYADAELDHCDDFPEATNDLEKRKIARQWFQGILVWEDYDVRYFMIKLNSVGGVKAKNYIVD